MSGRHRALPAAVGVSVLVLSMAAALWSAEWMEKHPE